MPSWSELFKTEIRKPYFSNMINNLQEISNSVVIFPKKSETFRSFSLTPLNEVKVVILGQDPYHGKIKPMVWLSL